MRLVTRYSFVDRNHINYEVTIEDPKVFSRPWKMRMPVYRRAEPNVTVENERAKTPATGDQRNFFEIWIPTLEQPLTSAPQTPDDQRTSGAIDRPW